MLMSEKSDYSTSNLAQTTKTFPNISKITQHNRLHAKHKIIYFYRINQRIRTNMERLSGIKWINHQVLETLLSTALST